MPKKGFEPLWENSHYALNVARLPIPPLRLSCVAYFISIDCFVNLNIKQSVYNFFIYLKTFKPTMKIDKVTNCSIFLSPVLSLHNYIVNP